MVYLTKGFSFDRELENFLLFIQTRIKKTKQKNFSEKITPTSHPMGQRPEEGPVFIPTRNFPLPGENS